MANDWDALALIIGGLISMATLVVCLLLIRLSWRDMQRSVDQYNGSAEHEDQRERFRGRNER